MRKEPEQIDFRNTYPTECPKCHGKVIVSDWKDAYIIWLHITCQNCGYYWREKIDLTL